jgi:indolepyruvate ferredoxin oxidoreductase, beta subunit
MKDINILIAGVGGQGTLLASAILGQLALDSGFDVKLSEVHGMAQRGGSVVTYARIGEKVYSPLIEQGGADVLIAFELLEAERWLPYVKQDGAVFINSQKILPMPVITGMEEYPADIKSRIQKHFADAIFVDALALACQAGNSKAVNTVMLGALAKHLEFSKDAWIAAMQKTVKEKFLALNTKAFELGLSV